MKIAIAVLLLLAAGCNKDWFGLAPVPTDLAPIHDMTGIDAAIVDMATPPPPPDLTVVKDLICVPPDLLVAGIPGWGKPCFALNDAGAPVENCKQYGLVCRAAQPGGIGIFGCFPPLDGGCK